MGVGVLDDPRTPFPPGTVILTERLEAAIGAESAAYDNYKKDGDVILQPQPSDSPNDPYNWSNKHKYWLIILLIVNAITVGSTQAMLGTGMRILAETYHTTFPEVIKHLTPPRIVAHAIGLLFTSTMAAVYGKRVLYVCGVCIIWAEMFSGWFANSLDYYTAISVVGGFASSFEVLNGPIITEMVFIHQRGRIMGLTAIVAVIGGDASHIISGNIISKLGIKYTFLVSCCIIAVLAILVYLFVWETTFARKVPEIKPKTETKNDLVSGSSTATAVEAGTGLKKDAEVTMIETLSPVSTNQEPAVPERKLTFREQLVVFRGRVTKRKLIPSILQPFPLLLFPSVLFSTFVSGAFSSWAQMAGLLSFQVMAYPPYNLQPDQLAYIGIPGSFVSLFASIGSGLLSDWLIKHLSRRNNGVYEPEFRLLLMIPAVIFSTMAFLLLGPAYQYKWSVAKIIACGLNFSLAVPFAANATVAYIYDTQKTTTTEAMVASALVKSIFGYFVTTYVPAWFAKVGALYAFRVLAVLNVSFSLLTIPMYIFGKRLRGAVARNKFLMKAAIHKEE